MNFQRTRVRAAKRRREFCEWISATTYKRRLNRSDYKHQHLISRPVADVKHFFQTIKRSRATYWQRKSDQIVIASLLVKIPRKEEFEIFRGINLEVSLPTGSNCAERHAIHAAVTKYPMIERSNFVTIAIMGLNPTNEEMTFVPREPCGVCSEWLKKIQEENSDFTVVCALSEDCNEVEQHFCSSPNEVVTTHYPPELQKMWPCLHCHHWNESKMQKCQKCGRRIIKKALPRRSLDVLCFLQERSSESLKLDELLADPMLISQPAEPDTKEGFLTEIHRMVQQGLIKEIKENGKERKYQIEQRGKAHLIGQQIQRIEAELDVDRKNYESHIEANIQYSKRKKKKDRFWLEKERRRRSQINEALVEVKKTGESDGMKPYDV